MIDDHNQWLIPKPPTQHMFNHNSVSALMPAFNLASSGNVTVSMRTIQESYKDLDGRLKQRLDLISKDADAKLRLIINDTETEEKRLVEYDKRQQAIQDELYQKWLQKYVVELNKWRSEELADLQQELMNYQANHYRKVSRQNQATW